MDMQPPKESVTLLEPEPLVDDLDDDEPTEEQILLGIREGLRQSLAGETRPIEELFEEIRREQALYED